MIGVDEGDAHLHKPLSSAWAKYAEACRKISWSVRSQKLSQPLRARAMRSVIGRRPGPLPGVDLGVLDPVPKRLGAHTELAGNPADGS
jgi:hypothetical protein